MEEEGGQARKRRPRSPPEAGGKKRRSCDPRLAPVAPARRQRHSSDEKLLVEEVAGQLADYVEEVAGQLADYVEEGSKEYKHERKKAHDRLYKRLKRDGQPINIKKHEVEAEMLNNFRAKLGKPLQYQPETRSTPPYTFTQEAALALPALVTTGTMDFLDAVDTMDTMDTLNTMDTLDTMEGLLCDTELEHLLVDSTGPGDIMWNQEDDLLAFLDPLS